jgi:hypothetical protein
MAKGRVKIPKQFLGIRVPKAIRQIGREVIANPLGREVIAEALVNAAAALLRKQARRGSTARKVIEHPIRSGTDAAESIASTTSDTASTVARAVDGLLGYLQGGADARTRKRKAKGNKRKAKKRRDAAEARTTH